MKRVVKSKSEFSINPKNCIVCNTELEAVGSQKDSHGWCQHFRCSNCGGNHEFSPNDMGQGSDHLSLVTHFEDHVPLKSGELSEQEFCERIYQFEGNYITQVDQLKEVVQSGRQLFEMCNFMIKNRS